MTIESLAAVAFAAMSILGRVEHVPPSEQIAHAIGAAVFYDDEGRLTGSAETDAVYMAEEAYQESRFGGQWIGSGLAHVDCPEGDGGMSFGYFQLQTRPEIGCSVDDAARLWVHWAHLSQKRCRRLPIAERLSHLHSGTCALGHVVSRFRWAQAAIVARALQ